MLPGQKYWHRKVHKMVAAQNSWYVSTLFKYLVLYLGVMCRYKEHSAANAPSQESYNSAVNFSGASDAATKVKLLPLFKNSLPELPMYLCNPNFHFWDLVYGNL